MEFSKVIIPAAGIGTEFLPYTSAIPQEMLPILEKPAIHYLFEECIAAELSHFFIITNGRKNAIADHLEPSAVLENYLSERGASGLIAGTKKLARMATYAFIREAEPLGIGHEILCAKQCIGKEYFCIALPTDFVDAPESPLKQLLRIARQEKTSILAVQEVPHNCVSSFEIIATKKTITPNLFQISEIIESPKPKDAPTNLAVIGRFVLSSKIFNALEYVNTFSEKREITLTDGINRLINDNERVLAYKINGTRYDLRTPLGWMKAIVGMGLKNPAYAPHLRSLIEESETSRSILYNPARAIENSL